MTSMRTTTRHVLAPALALPKQPHQTINCLRHSNDVSAVLCAVRTSQSATTLQYGCIWLIVQSQHKHRPVLALPLPATKQAPPHASKNETPDKDPPHCATAAVLFAV
jgi:hypothetical protein